MSPRAGARPARPPGTPDMRFQLRQGLHFCRAGDLAIFLDVANDRYFALTETLSAAFLRLADNSIRPVDEVALESLVGTVLVRGPGGPPATAALPVCPGRSAWDHASTPHWGAVLGAMAAVIGARRALRRRGLEYNLEKLAICKTTPGLIPDDLDAAAPVAAAFRAATRYMSANDQCLPHSVAVATQLFRRGVPATFVIGVIARPFQAHCWVQVDDLVVNDRIDTVRDFTPILVI